MIKVIFLDIDGVLNSRAYDRKRDWNGQTDIDETRLPLVKQIVEKSGAKIVLSSTWRQHWDRDPQKCDVDGEYIDRTFAKYGLRVYDKTPDLGICAARREEILRWLADTAEKIAAYVIIDDDRFGWEELSDHVVKTDPVFHLGLERETAKRAIAILNA